MTLRAPSSTWEYLLEMTHREHSSYMNDLDELMDTFVSIVHDFTTRLRVLQSAVERKQSVNPFKHQVNIDSIYDSNGVGAGVYVIYNGTNFVKIGHTRKLKQRISDLSVGSPFPLDLLVWIPCEDSKQAANLEGLIHTVMGAWRVKGEFFCIYTCPETCEESPVSIFIKRMMDRPLLRATGAFNVLHSMCEPEECEDDSPCRINRLSIYRRKNARKNQI